VVLVIIKGAEERLESELEETPLRIDREWPFDRGVLDEAGPDAAAAAVAAATALLMSRGIRILNGDFVISDAGAGSGVITEGPVFADAVGGLCGFRRVEDSASEWEFWMTCIGDEVNVRTVLRFSIGDEVVGTVDEATMLVSAREREALVTWVGVDESKGIDFGG
jgi:hypothetical protein